MNNLLIKFATRLRCFYDTLILVDYEKDKLKEEIEELKREMKLQQMVMTFDVKLHEYMIIKKYAESAFIEFDDVQGFVMMFCRKPFLLGRYGIPKNHCINRESVLKYCEDFLK